jgi:hypothetical protein
MMKDFLQGLNDPGFVIADSPFPAKRFDDCLRRRQLILPQEREEVVFDLIIQPAVQKIIDWAGSDVA